MSTKLPFIQFYPVDWSADTRILSLSARGAWLEMIIAMHVRGRTDTVSGTPARLAGLIGCSETEFLSVLEELKTNDIAEITECNGVVTVVCRRLKSEKNERENTRERVKRHRCNGDVTEMKQDCSEDVTVGRVQSTEKENPLTGVKEKTLHQPHTFEFPKSVKEVLKLAEHPWCGMKCTEEQANAYFTDRVSRAWIPYGQQKPISSMAQICADLKKWLMRDQNEIKERKTRNGNDTRFINNESSSYDESDDGSNI